MPRQRMLDRLLDNPRSKTLHTSQGRLKVHMGRSNRFPRSSLKDQRLE
jgi:hypothetical protein